MPEIRVILESEDEKTKIELEAKRHGLTQTALLRLIFKDWIGEVNFKRKDGDDKTPGDDVLK